MTDAARTQEIYDYLVQCFANYRQNGEELSDRAIARCFKLDDETDEAARGRVSKLRDHKPITTADLVKYLRGLRKLNRHDVDPSDLLLRLLTPEETLFAFQKLVQLTPEEKKGLSLPYGEEEILLQQALLNIRLHQHPPDCEQILSLYKASLGIDAVPPRALEENPEEHLKTVIEEVVQRYFEYASVAPESLKNSLKEKAKREVDRILTKCGVEQVRLNTKKVKENYIQKYFPDSFVERLARSVVENELLTNIFPIYIKTISVREIGPFPITVASDPQKHDLLYGPFLELDHFDREGKQIASQTAQAVTVNFYLRLPSDYKPTPEVAETFKRLQRQDHSGSRIDFSVSSFGIGGTLSHVIKIINTTLLSDIEGLKDYFPIAHDIAVHHEMIRNNVSSPIWAHTLVQLCKTKTLAKAMSESHSGKLQPYEQFAFGDRIGRGDYCGFDLLLCPANAALQARLRAIRYTGIAPHRYRQQFCHRILQLQALREAQAYVTSYPFSSFAQEGRLRTTLLNKLGPNLEQGLSKSDPYLLFDACLTIVETFLDEGMYRRAHAYLDRVGRVLKTISDTGIRWYDYFGDKLDEDEFEVFSGMLLVRFELCRALYFYMADPEAEVRDSAYLPDYFQQYREPQGLHKELLRESWRALNNAEEHLTIRLVKYSLINEVSQGTFHPHYQLLAKIYFLRARILTFFPHLIERERGASPHRLPTDTGFNHRSDAEIYNGRLYLMEKARLYAASDGDTERYACYTAYQAWMYLITAFVPERTEAGRNLLREFRLEERLNWALRLRDHALQAYAETGRHCYYQIKEKSGAEETLLPDLGNYEIGTVPPIVETRGEQEPGLRDEVLYLDMSLLAVRKDCLTVKDGADPDEFIYLFGTNACYLLLIRGLYHLCSNSKEEFRQDLQILDTLDWDLKLRRAYRLFSYAWATADDGGNVEPQGPNQLRITRDFTASEAIGGNADAASVRDLCPYRASEMADLGRIFAAACAILRLSVVPVQEQAQIQQEIAWLLQDLQRQDYCCHQATLLQDQPRYNGHLSFYIERCKSILTTQLAQIPSVAPTVDSMKQRRDRLVRNLFEALYKSPTEP